MRMGKGKGGINKKVAVIKAGAVLLKLENLGISNFLVKKLMNLISSKVPLRHSVLLNN